MADKTELNLARLRACDGEEIWRTINHAKVLIDEGTGKIKGGAGGKMNGQTFKPSFGRSAKTGKKILAPSIFAKPKHHVYGSKADLLKKLKGAVEPPKTKTKDEVGKAYRDVYYTDFFDAKSIDELDKMKEESDKKIKEFEGIFKQLDRSTLVKDPNLGYDFAYRVLSGDNVVENLRTSVQNDYDYAKKSIMREEATKKAKAAWVKVVKYKTAMNAAKTLAGKQTNQQRLKDAYDAYKAEVAKAPYGRVNFKPKTSSVDALLNKTADDLKSEINSLTNQGSRGNIAPNLAGGSKHPNFTLDKATATSHMHMVNLLHAMGARGSNLSDAQLASTIKSKMADIMKNSYPSVPMATFKNSSTEDVVNKLYAGTRRMQKNPLLNNHPLQQITAGLGLDKPPAVLSEADFKAYVKKNKLPVMYRSVGHGPRKNSYGLGGKNKTDGFRYDDNAWTGEGIYGDGHYFAQNWGESRGYGDYTIKAAIDPAKVKAFDYHRDLKKVPYDVRHDTQLLPIWCLQHGYNVIYIEGGNYGRSTKGHDYWSVLDRSCLIVSEEDCNDHP